MFTTAPPLEEDALHSLSSQTASSAAVGTYGRFEGERSRGSGASILARSAQLLVLSPELDASRQVSMHRAQSETARVRKSAGE